jgi:hypothetical protein
MFITVALFAAAGAQQPAATPVANPMICKRTEVTGSNIRSTTCMKKSDWDLLDKNSENKLSNMHGRTNVVQRPNDRGGSPN